MRHSVLASLILAACAGSEAPSDPLGTIVPPKAQVNAYGEEEQGRFILGNIADGLAAGGFHFSVTAPTGMSIGVSGTTLIIKGTGGTASWVPAQATLVLPASGGGSALRIDMVDAAGYTVSYWDTATSGWLPYCDAAESPYAIAMPGVWTTGGLHDLDPTVTRVTFACQVSGKAAKCVSVGYAPETTDPVGPGRIGWDLNQACVQLMRADYCGDGKSHTREKTPVRIRDHFFPGAEPNIEDVPLRDTPASYPPTPPPPDVFYYEAAWAPRQPVLCLNRLRWDDFELEGPCRDVLPDPRVHPMARFCEDAHLDTTERNMFNSSLTMDLAMHSWNDGAGDTVTTVHGYVVDEGKSRHMTVPPVGYNGPPLSAEGYLLRNQTGELKEPDTVFKVYRLHNATTGDTVVGPPGMLAGYDFTEADFEGYLIIDSAPDNLPLYLYKRGDDYVTATKRPSAGLFPYNKVGGADAPPIGYVIAGSL